MIYPGKLRGEFFPVRSNPVLERLCFLPFSHGLRLTWESFSSRLGATRPCRANEAMGSRPKHGRGCNQATFHICWNIFCNSEAVSSSRWWQEFISKWLSVFIASVPWNVVALVNCHEHSFENLRLSLKRTLSFSLLASEYNSNVLLCLCTCKPSEYATVTPRILNFWASKLVI
jgi:hypothetical protein